MVILFMDKLRDSKGKFVKGNSGYWTGKKRPDMYGHTWNNGRIAWNKGLTKETDERVAKYAKTISGENNCKWKGDNAGYQSIHRWINRKFGKPEICEKCGSKNRIQWANKTNKYLRDDRDDWMQLCQSCHLKYDYKNGRGVPSDKFGLRRFRK
jgi:hypothetical protein